VIQAGPHLPIAADQTWYWRERWQAREREVDVHRDAGRLTTQESAEEFLRHLDDIAGE